ncbi:MAG: ATP-binding protein [Rhodobacterales bacterium]|nr:ATP-binding protein [Rhodobacterales bacterium]
MSGKLTDKSLRGSGHMRIVRKWRPPLALVLGCTLIAVLSLPAFGLVILLTWGPEIGFSDAVWLVGGGIVGITGLIGFVLWRILLRPIQAMAARAADIKAGRAGGLEPLQHYGTAELRDLGQAMLDMGVSLQNRAAGLRAYSDHVTHEMKSPLTGIIGAAELLSGDIAAADRAELIASIQASAARMQGHLDGLRILSAAREPVGEGRVLLSDAVALLRPDITLVVESDGQVPLSSGVMVAILEQLVQNAVQHEASEIRLNWRKDALRIADNGSGIASGNMARIFDPFFTTNRANGGTGLGLSIVRNLLEAAGGEINLAAVSRSTQGGAMFEIRF